MAARVCTTQSYRNFASPHHVPVMRIEPEPRAVCSRSSPPPGKPSLAPRVWWLCYLLKHRWCWNLNPPPLDSKTIETRSYPSETSNSQRKKREDLQKTTTAYLTTINQAQWSSEIAIRKHRRASHRQLNRQEKRYLESKTAKNGVMGNAFFVNLRALLR